MTHPVDLHQMLVPSLPLLFASHVSPAFVTHFRTQQPLLAPKSYNEGKTRSASSYVRCPQIVPPFLLLKSQT
eukprot:m.15235 g.15235  ORF g.15235 m.15235 type:complete len:72 (-) comp6537_c0_seq1:99-314(-)